MQLEFSSAEAAVLADVVDTALGELREEIYKSEVADYKTTLKQRETLLTGVLQRLRGASVSSS